MSAPALLHIGSCLQLADEEAGSEKAQALGQNVLGEDVDETWEENKGDSCLVDEEEGDELGHRRLEDRLLLALVSIYYCFTIASLTICCTPTSGFLFWPAMRAGRDRTEGRAAIGARKAAALAKGRRKRAFIVGYLELCGSARCCGGPIGEMKFVGGELAYRTTCIEPGEMSSDGVAIAGSSVVLCYLQ